MNNIDYNEIAICQRCGNDECICPRECEECGAFVDPEELRQVSIRSYDAVVCEDCDPRLRQMADKYA